MDSLKDKACIVGVGESAFTRGSGKTELQLMLEASAKALEDAGLKPHDIDGIVGPPLGASAEHFAANLGIEDLRYCDVRADGRCESGGRAAKRRDGGRVRASPNACWCRADGTATR